MKVYAKLKVNTTKIKVEASLSSRVWTSAFAKQSASFALATTHSQDVLFNASRPYRRSPSAYFEGTHGVRFAWGNTDAIDFVAIASSLQATNSRRAVGNTNRLKAVPLRFVRQLRTQTAQSLVLSVKLGVRFLAALRLAFRLRKCVFCFNQKDEATMPRLFD